MCLPLAIGCRPPCCLNSIGLAALLESVTSGVTVLSGADQVWSAQVAT